VQASADAEKALLQTTLEPLMRVAKAHARGPEDYARSIVHDLLENFANVEEKFQVGESEGKGARRDFEVAGSCSSRLQET
jgi:hypothetical protein